MKTLKFLAIFSPALYLSLVSHYHLLRPVLPFTRQQLVATNKKKMKKDCKCRSRSKTILSPFVHDTFNKLKIEIEQISCSLIFSRLLLSATAVHNRRFPSSSLLFLISHEPTKWKKHFSSSSFSVLAFFYRHAEFGTQGETSSDAIRTID